MGAHRRGDQQRDRKHRGYERTEVVTQWAHHFYSLSTMRGPFQQTRTKRWIRAGILGLLLAGQRAEPQLRAAGAMYTSSNRRA